MADEEQAAVGGAPSRAPQDASLGSAGHLLCSVLLWHCENPGFFRELAARLSIAGSALYPAPTTTHINTLECFQVSGVTPRTRVLGCIKTKRVS